MNHRTRLVAGFAATGMLGAVLLTAPPAQASSHREAPLISQDPSVDNTDLYAFRDTTDPTKLNIIANFIGLEDPAAGPNFIRFADDAVYQIHINSKGDGIRDITYEFRFSTTVANPNTFLYNTGPLASPSDPNLNVRQTYSVRKIVKSADRTTESLEIMGSDLPVAPANIGPRSTPNYEETIGKKSVVTLTNGDKVFAGPRKDAFFADLGSVFDLLGLRPLNSAHAIPLPDAPGVNGLAGKNVHEIAIQIPIDSVTKNRNAPTVVDDPASVVGIYSVVKRQQTRVLSDAKSIGSGNWVQVSRLGLPLVNEVLIPLKDKDRFNLSEPQYDVDNYGASLLNPEPAALMKALYGLNVPDNPRTSDLVPILRGAGAGLSAPNYLPPMDILRINVAVPPSATPDRLGILAGDSQGFPNGRRLNDDVVDILLRVLAGGTPFTPATNVFPNNALTDGVDTSEIQPVNYFPYQAPPDSRLQPASGASTRLIGGDGERHAQRSDARSRRAPSVYGVRSLTCGGGRPGS